MKKVFTLLSILISFIHLQAQDIQPVLQSGHSNKIEFYDFNEKNGVIMTADQKEVMLWNKYSGKQLRRISSDFMIRGAAFCSDGEELAVITYEYGKDAALRIYNARNGKLISEISFADKTSWGVKYNTLDELIVDQLNNRVAIRYFSEISIVDIKERKKAYHFELDSYDNKFSFTDNPLVFAIAMKMNEDLQLRMVDTTGYNLGEIKLAEKSQPLTFITNKQQDKFFILDNKASVFIADSKLHTLGSFRADSISKLATYSKYSMALSNDETKIIVPLHESQYLYDLEKKSWIEHDWKWMNQSSKAFFAGEAEAVVIQNTVPIIIKTDNGRQLHTLSGKSSGNKNIRFSPSSRMMSVYSITAMSSSSYILDLQTGMQMSDAEINFAIFQWITDSLVLCSLNPEYDSESGEFIHELQIRNVYNGNVMHSIKLSKLEWKIEYATISADRNKIALLSMKKAYLYFGNNFDKSLVYTMPENNGAKNAYFTPDNSKLVLPTDVIRTYSFDTKKWKLGKDTARYGFDEVSFTADGKQIWYDEYKEMPRENSSIPDRKPVIVVHNIETGSITIKKTFDTLVSCIAIHPKEDLYATGFFNGLLQLRKVSTDELLYEAKVHNDYLQGIIFSPSKPWVLAVGRDGQIKTINYADKKTMLTISLLHTQEESGFALITPDNYYLVPATLINEIHFAKEFQTYSFGQLDLRLNRPDKVLERMGIADQRLLDIYKKAYQRRLQKAGYNNENFPDLAEQKPLQIINRSEITDKLSSENILLKLTTNQATEDINSIRVYINGQKIADKNGKQNNWEIPVKLGSGINNVEAAYVDKTGMESLRERVEINYEPAVKENSTLYYIGVAVSSYKDSVNNLKYAVKDVSDISKKFMDKDSTAKCFLFLDDAAVKSNIDSIKRILSSTGINDKVVMSFSGHGLLDTAYNFYFASWDMDFSKPQQKGISLNDINDLLNNVPAQKKLVLIDACHSGELDKDQVSFTPVANKDTQYVKTYTRGQKLLGKKSASISIARLMEQYFSDLNKENGANIISAAAGEEFALESDEWNNGVFSYSFMKGIFDNAADANSDRHVSQTEIRKYMQRNVLQLTGGKQQPSARNINMDYNWVFKTK